MVYVYVNGKRMQYLQEKLHASPLQKASQLRAGDTLVLPILKAQCEAISLEASTLKLSDLHGLRIIMASFNSLLPCDNTFLYYMMDECLLLENAKLTAQGMAVYMSQKGISLPKATVDILGGGRCGQALYIVLTYLGADCRILHTYDMPSYKHDEKAYIIINTAPQCILDAGDFVCDITKFIFDISSEKCCLHTVFEESNIEVIHPGSLPELFFPCSGGTLIYDFIRRYCDET